MSPKVKSKDKGGQKEASPGTREAGIVKSLRAMQGVERDDVMLMSGGPLGNIPKRSSGILTVDVVIGGGYPYGKIIEIFGPEGSGKTTLTLHAIEAVQRAGGACAFIDAEHALNPHYATDLGVDMSRLMLSQPSCGEQALELIEMFARVMQPGDLIVVDSVAALTPQAEIDGEMGDSHVGLQARLMSQAMRKLTGVLSTTGVIVIFINQIRMKIGVMFGSPETTSGGNALKFYAYIRLDIRKKGAVKKDEVIVGNAVKIKCIKNKCFPPFREAEAALRYGIGLPRHIDVLTVAKLVGVVETSGAHYHYAGERIGHGKDKAAEFLKENPELVDEIEQKILEIYQIKRD